MERDNEFKRLESHLERLLENYAAIKAENRRLDRDCQELKAENQQLKGQISLLESEKSEVGSRVERIIGRIEAWESELELSSDDLTGEEAAVAAGGHTEDEEKQKVEAVEPEERGGGVQTSLFTAERGTAGKTAVQT